jgi:hypothetical protein
MKNSTRSTLKNSVFIIFTAVLAVISLISCENKNSTDPVMVLNLSEAEQNFRSVPVSDRVWVYYWWLKGNVTKESITQDLTAMKNKGIGGFLLFDSRGYYDDYVNGIIPVPLKEKMEFMSPEWREMVKFTMQEASRLGLEMSINLANTGGSLRGPWDLGKDGPKKLIWTSASVKGPGKLNLKLSTPPDTKFYSDVALIAVKTNDGEASTNNPDDLNGKWNEVNVSKGNAPLAGKVMNLNNRLKDGQLQWNIPDGEWKIVRFGSTVIADLGSVDILNKEAVTRYFNLMGKVLLDDAGPLAGKTLKYFYNVSWEGGEPNWTVGFEQEFSKFRGYKIKDYMPVLAGMTVENHEISLRFMRDYFRTVSDCFVDNCYRTIGDLCHARGIQWHAENGGPWRRNAAMFRDADMLTFWGSNDIPQGEFWAASMKDIEKQTNARFTAMAAHIYGKPLAAIEAFTHMTTHWSKYPAYLKPIADNNFAAGTNMFIWHTFTASPPEIGKPGYEYFAGTHINPRVTWWNEAGDFMNYLSRCQYLLRKGRFVADICAYTSDKNYVEWGRGRQWNEKSSLKIGPGYTFDLLNTDVLVNRLRVKGGKLVLPDGMNYKMLVVDLEDKTIPLDAIQKILSLSRAGATIILGQNKPERTPGLKHYPRADRRVNRMANELWDNARDGKVFKGVTMEQVLMDKGLKPDFEGPFEYIHRTFDDGDIYFICGTGKAECTFRVQDKKPQFWNPVNGHISNVVNYRLTNDGRIVIPITLPQYGSMFVVFTGTKENKYITSVSGPNDGLIIKDMKGDTLNLVLWKSGDYNLTSSMNKSGEIKTEIIPEIELTKPWEVSFTPGWGAPEKIRFDKLKLWNAYPDPGIKYFSGTGTYKTTFTLSEEQAKGPCLLNLGKVWDIAKVYLNGKDLGVVWTAPWSVDITSARKTGENELEIEVTNCWANRLIGDCSLPDNKRFTHTNVRLLPERGKYKDYEAFSAKDTLLSSGLQGPVTIEFGKEKEVVF